MTDSERLEREYRRLVALYPRSFRRASEEEIVGVLLATARDGQRRVGLAESADLIRGALRMHRGPRLPRALLLAVRLAYAGAAAELAVLIALLVTLASLTSATIRSDPDFTVAQWRAVVLLSHEPPAVAGALVLVGLWVWLACENARGNHAARVALWGVWAVIKIGIAAEGIAVIAVYGIGGALALAVVILVHFGAMAAIFYPSKDPLPYRPHRQLDPAQR
jgi:hypothetical protein